MKKLYYIYLTMYNYYSNMIFKNRGFLSKNSKTSIYNFFVNDLNNSQIDLNTKRNKIILIVNSASS